MMMILAFYFLFIIYAELFKIFIRSDREVDDDWNLSSCIHSQNVLNSRRLAWCEKIFRYESNCEGKYWKIHEKQYEKFSLSKFSQFSTFSLFFLATLHAWKCFDKKNHEIVTDERKSCNCCHSKDFRITIITANNNRLKSFLNSL